MREIHIICGPTAGGKTDYALSLAKFSNGVVINADSRQIFKELCIISASPSDKMKREVPHYLYNFLDSSSSYDISSYIDDVQEILKTVSDRNIYIVGGSGLYINSLIKGIAHIPIIPQEIREYIRRYHIEVGNELIYQELSQIDPESASKLNINDTHRILRAYEVIKATGKSIGYWQRISFKKPILNETEYKIHLIMPPRDVLYKNCNRRFNEMLDLGAIEEVKSLKNPGAQILSTIGVKQILNYLDGNLPFDEMIRESQTKTRQYAKRQVTWFKNQISQDFIL